MYKQAHALIIIAHRMKFSSKYSKRTNYFNNQEVYQALLDLHLYYGVFANIFSDKERSFVYESIAGKKIKRLRTERPDWMSAPQIATFDRTKVTVPQIKRGSSGSIVGNIGSKAWVPPWVSGEGTDRCHWWWLKKIEQRLLA